MWLFNNAIDPRTEVVSDVNTIERLGIIALVDLPLSCGAQCSCVSADRALFDQEVRLTVAYYFLTNFWIVELTLSATQISPFVLTAIAGLTELPQSPASLSRRCKYLAIEIQAKNLAGESVAI